MQDVKRNSNFELMRIISILMVILWNIINSGNFINNCNNRLLDLVMLLIECYLVVHVNAFVLLSGYYQSEQKYSRSKFFKILNASWFYRVLIVLIFLIFKITPISGSVIFRESFIFDIVNNWFIKIYLMMYLLSPFINKLINNINKKDYQKLLVILFCILCILPFITFMSTFKNTGYTLYHFIYLYLIGAYLKRYPVSKSIKYREYNKKTRRTIYISKFIFLGFINFGVYQTLYVIMSTTSAMDQYLQIISNGIFYFNNPIVVIQAVYFFLFFETLDIKNHYINKIASTCLGVYLIHANSFVSSVIYKWLGIDRTDIRSFAFIFYMLLVMVIIFVLCSLIELLRQYLFKKVYDLKISLYLRDKFNKWIDSFNFFT